MGLSQLREYETKPYANPRLPELDLNHFTTFNFLLIISPLHLLSKSVSLVPKKPDNIIQDDTDATWCSCNSSVQSSREREAVLVLNHTLQF